MYKMVPQAGGEGMDGKKLMCDPDPIWQNYDAKGARQPSKRWEGGEEKENKSVPINNVSMEISFIWLCV